MLLFEAFFLYNIYSPFLYIQKKLYYISYVIILIILVFSRFSSSKFFSSEFSSPEFSLQESEETSISLIIEISISSFFL